MFSHKNNIINYLVVTSLLFTIILWFGQIWYFNDWYFVDKINEFSVFLKYIGKATAIITTILICWSFILNAILLDFCKIKIDKSKLLTKKIQITKVAFVLMFVDPIFLAFNRLPNVGLFAQFFFFKPATSLYGIGHNIGLGLLLLIFFGTIFTKLTFVDRFVKGFFRGLFAIIPFLILIHILFVKSDITKHLPLQLWIFSWLVTAIFTQIISIAIEFQSSKNDLQ